MCFAFYGTDSFWRIDLVLPFSKGRVFFFSNIAQNYFEKSKSAVLKSLSNSVLSVILTTFPFLFNVL